jgi:hypothetical protein
VVHKGWAIEEISFTQAVAHAKANDFERFVLQKRKNENERRMTKQMDRVKTQKHNSLAYLYDRCPS